MDKLKQASIEGILESAYQKGKKAGYEKRESEFVYNPDYLDFQKGVEAGRVTGKQLGIRLVVEWINNHGGSLDGHREEWQAQLKAWFKED